MSVLNIFGATPPPGTYTVYGDGNPNVVLGQSFTTYGGKLPDAQCIGGRVYVPDIGAHPHTSKVTIKAWLGTDLTVAPVQQKEVAVAAPGWIEATFDAPFDMPADGSPVTIGYQFTGTEFGITRYVHTPGLRASGAPIQAVGDVGLELAAAPSTYLLLGGSQTTQPSNVGYGIDVLVEGNPIEPEPENVPPSVNGGANRTMFVGQTATLTGTASDGDGTVASIDWTQVSGPSVSLAGSGAVRTFTPSTVGTYVFVVTATDDDGATSTPDPVTITVQGVPVELEPTNGTARPVKKMGSVERALMALFVRDLQVLDGSDAKIGGEFPREVDDFYIRIDRVPGGRATTFEGDYVLDVEVFSYDYLRAEDIAEDIEVLMLADGYHSIVTGGKRWTFDGVFQNVGIADIPWEVDEDMSRLMATYAVTVRRGAV